VSVSVCVCVCVCERSPWINALGPHSQRGAEAAVERVRIYFRRGPLAPQLLRVADARLDLQISPRRLAASPRYQFINE